MKIIIKYTHLCLMMLILLLTACDFGQDPEENDYYNFKVMGAGDNFTGYYSVDGGSFKIFNGTAVEGSSVYYSYEQNLESPESILVSVTATTVNTSSISIYIYSNDELVASDTESQIDITTKVTLTLSHAFSSSSSK